ncbi:MAG TPA: DJ-1/PfpI family protein [Methanosarcinales archaeon]|nr:DJ-1/PfpI family protein [Methanosarcinales archaeon]
MIIMKHITVVIGLVLCITALGCITGPDDDTKVNTMTDLTDKTILMVVAPSNFRDEELFVPKEFFEKNGIKVVVASKEEGIASGMLGGSINVDIRVNDADASDYDAVVFVGGSGVDSQRLYDDPGYLKLAKDANDAGKLVCAICLGPMIPANAGLLSGRNATVFTSGVSYIKERGATYTGTPVTRDGRIITAEGPGAAEEFAETIIKAFE